MGSEIMHLEKDFTLLLVWLCIFINDTLLLHTAEYINMY